MKLIRHILVLTACLLVAACETEMEVKLFATDFTDSVEEMKLDAQLYLEIPSAKWLDEEANKSKLVQFLGRHFKELGDLSTKSVGMTTFCVVPFKTVLASTENKDEIFGLSRAKTDAGMDLNCEIQKERFKAFAADVSESFMSSIRLESVRFRVLLYNDTSGPINVTGYSCYLGDVPAAFEGATTLERRKELAIRVSEIHLSAIYAAGKSRLLTVGK